MDKSTKENLKGTAMSAIRKLGAWLKRGGITAVAIIIALVAVWFAWSQHSDNIKTQVKSEELETQLKDVKAQRDKNAKELESTSAKLKKIEEDLSYANDQVELLEDTTAALKRQISDLNVEKETLEKKVKDLLKIIENKPKITVKLLDEQITSIEELATLKYFYTNASRKEGNLTWLWGWTLPFSDSSLLVTYDGTIKAGINLNEIKFEVNENERTITATLPKSRILDHNIPQETINVLEVKNGLFNPVTFDDYNKFIAEEKKVMEQKVIDKGLLTDADKETRKVVEAFLKGIPGMDTYNLNFK